MQRIPEADALNVQKLRRNICPNIQTNIFVPEIYSIKVTIDMQRLQMMILKSLKSYSDLRRFGGVIQFLKPRS